MKISDLTPIIDFTFDFADNDIDCTFYCDIHSILPKYAKQIEVIKINEDYVTCNFTKFIAKHRTAIKKYLYDNYYISDTLTWLINELYIPNTITDSEALYHFINYDLSDFLTKEY